MRTSSAGTPGSMTYQARKRGPRQLWPPPVCPRFDHRGHDRLVIAPAPRPAVRPRCRRPSVLASPLAIRRQRRSAKPPRRRRIDRRPAGTASGCAWPHGTSRATLYLHCATGEAPVTTGPQDPAAAGRDRLRACHADREQVLETLKDAFVRGRLTKDELDTRAGRALAARTYADLAPLTADIPPAPAATGAAHPPAPARRRPLAQGGRQVGHLPGHRGRCRAGRLHLRSGSPRPHSPSFLGSPDAFPGLYGRIGGTGLRGVRGAHLQWSRDAPRGSRRPGQGQAATPRRRTTRQHRPWPGSCRPSHRPDPHRPAGAHVAAAPAARPRPGGPGTP